MRLDLASLSEAAPFSGLKRNHTTLIYAATLPAAREEAELIRVDLVFQRRAHSDAEPR